ncbi:hypothetical protein QC764_0027020 [Podospora pseudoanserina]|uniref:Uncharacterized protein n=1 Tax=Podospora pseudoanserina TaxID=2609844 RepID=A0ABR0IRZ9_9PEZI|nr:hypothetical protein QC764_0027020 [Podospora pseudoanserina]
MPPVPPLILRGQYKNLAPRSPIVAGLINKLNRGFPALLAESTLGKQEQLEKNYRLATLLDLDILLSFWRACLAPAPLQHYTAYRQRLRGRQSHLVRDGPPGRQTNDTSEAFGKTHLRSAFWVLGVRAELEKHAPDLSSNHNRPSRSSSSHPPPLDPSPWKLTSVRQTAAGRYTPGSSSASIRQGEI